MLSLRKIHTEEGSPSPLALSLLVAFYDTQRIRWRYSLLYARHHRAFYEIYKPIHQDTACLLGIKGRSIIYLTLSEPQDVCNVTLSLWQKAPQNFCNVITRKSKFPFFARYFSQYFTFYLPFDLFPWFYKKIQSFPKKTKPSLALKLKKFWLLPRSLALCG